MFVLNWAILSDLQMVIVRKEIISNIIVMSGHNYTNKSINSLNVNNTME